MNIISKLKFVIAFTFFAVNSYGQISEAEIIATGLTCSMCSNSINKQLKALAEVDSVATDLNTNTFTVYLKAGSKVQPRDLKESVEKAGFFVGSMIVTLFDDNIKASEQPIVVNDQMTLIVIDKGRKDAEQLSKVKILDKGYVTKKEFKKLSKSYSKYATYIAENEDDYHVKPI